MLTRCFSRTKHAFSGADGNVRDPKELPFLARHAPWLPGWGEASRAHRLKKIPVVARLLTATLLIAPSALASDVVTLTYGDWPPYQSVNLPEGGATTHFVTKAFRKVGIEVKYMIHPWKRGEEMARSGEVDGTLAYMPTQERDEHFIYSGTLLAEQRHFLHRKDGSFTWKDIDDLKGLKIGVLIGYVYGTEFEEAAKHGLFRIEKVATEKQNIAKVLEGRVDAFPVDRNAGEWVLRADFTPQERDKLVFHPRALGRFEYVVMFSRKLATSLTFRDKFNKGLALLANEIGKERLIRPCDRLDHLPTEHLDHEDERVIRASCR